MEDIVKEIYTDLIDDPKDAMRTELDRDSIHDLADNIKINGLINPITVRPVGERYEVVAGHRRLTAHKYAGILKIKCVVRDLDDNKTFDIMAAENLERADVDVVDESIFITRYLDKTKLSIPEVAKKLRRSVAWVDSRLAIGEMPEYLQQYLKDNDIKLGVALELMNITDESTRELWVNMAVRDGVSIAQARYWVSGWKMNQLPGGTSSDVPPDGFTSGTPSVVMFECYIDGQKYDARQFRTIMVHESNLDALNVFVSEMRKPARSDEFEPRQE